ncbi:Rv3654c family TadE-like protein [Paractinoplanes toevensis]|uniref:Putative Flp pilus-assembly TadG-like N-terminal domain-containing protein n=1 Tax=Paractinoplanes toevensis TaxID=571911 RepID=A0A919VZR8_9ACTN|nr:Rv3654c family TadE-like protein [Actinoplanes toevensis]GIM90437.1 hypothetical protein Ato02nite_022300 [Actinoplanes toevensis]
MRRADRDRGAATVFVLAIGLTLVAAGLAGASVGTARVGRHQARSAADLGALAGAPEAIFGRPAVCDRAGHFVSANGGEMTLCVVEGLEVTVRAEVEVHPVPGMTRHATAESRAGPIYVPVE